MIELLHSELGCGRKQSALVQGTVVAFFWEDWGKSLQTLGQEGRSPGQDLNLSSSEYEPGMLTTRPSRSAKAGVIHINT